jgi:hypothetical protein
MEILELSPHIGPSLEIGTKNEDLAETIGSFLDLRLESIEN